MQRPHGPLLALMIAVAAPLAPAAAAGTVAETELAEPRPDWDNPRRIVLQLTEDDPKKINGVLYNAVNLQDFYGADNVKIAVITYAGGVRALLKGDSPVPDRIASLQQYGIEFVACGNTLETIGKSPADLLPDVTVVKAGIAEIVERKLRGWTYIVP